MTRLNELPEPLAEELVTLVHLHQPHLVLRELQVQLVDSLRSTGSDSDEGSRVVEGTNGDGILFLLDLTFEEPDAARHLVDAANLTDEGALERIDIRIQLSIRGPFSITSYASIKHKGM